MRGSVSFVSAVSSGVRLTAAAGIAVSLPVRPTGGLNGGGMPMERATGP